ncbi:low molecular weight protein-tyrosine-phosphatase [Geofilum sp. OHC36d9]|uniref:low molecular weight protein-tyrosine-phosphatase n=1 Tax=Geofilum sp. OHC36d9 TaxID=3458413 RepID=UPI0040338363
MDKTKILFVCLGNICRSPSAKAVMISVVEKYDAENNFEIDSAGILSVHAGEPADSRMKKHASERGYLLNNISRPIKSPVDFDYYDIIIGMDDQNIRDLKRLAPTECQGKIRKMTDFLIQGQAEEVPDPYYGGEAGFEMVLDLLEDACEGLYQHLVFGKN